HKFIPGTNDQFIITAYINGNLSQHTDFGLIFGVFDHIKPLNIVEPFTAGIPSKNTYTFTLSERVDIDNNEEWFSTVNKQNTDLVSAFSDGSIAIKYAEKERHTLYDIVGEAGGDLTLALALW
ncbi:11182_t:CDS:2, partial [Diversispora eburnea]